jgi:parvulin-like peptidyl-prolyl isomerase
MNLNSLRKRVAASSGLLVILALGALAGCSKGPAPDTSILATVGEHVIRVPDLQKEIAWRQSARRNVPEPRALLEEMVLQEALLQKARAAGLEKDPELLRSWRSLLVSKLKESELSPRLEELQVSPEELRLAYEKQLDRLTEPGKAHLALVQVKTHPKMSEPQLAELRTRIEEARVQSLALTNGELGFGKVAVAYSEDQASRYKGGDVGWFDEGQSHYRWPAGVISAGFALTNPGQVSAVIHDTTGFYLVKKLDTRSAIVTPSAQVEERLRRQLLAEKRKQAEQSFFNSACRMAGVQTYSNALASLLAPPTAVARRITDEPPSLP